MPTSYRYTGQRLDADTGLYFYNARYYDPALGRFTQPDTIVPNPGVRPPTPGAEASGLLGRRPVNGPFSPADGLAPARA